MMPRVLGVAAAFSTVRPFSGAIVDGMTSG